MTSAEGNIVTIEIADITNTLRVPDVIKDWPQLEFKFKLLFKFINNVQEALSRVSCTEE